MFMTSDDLNLTHDYQRLRMVPESFRNTIHADLVASYAFNVVIYLAIPPGENGQKLGLCPDL